MIFFPFLAAKNGQRYLPERGLKSAFATRLQDAVCYISVSENEERERFYPTEVNSLLRVFFGVAEVIRRGKAIFGIRAALDGPDEISSFPLHCKPWLWEENVSAPRNSRRGEQTQAQFFLRLNVHPCSLCSLPPPIFFSPPFFPSSGHFFLDDFLFPAVLRRLVGPPLEPWTLTPTTSLRSSRVARHSERRRLCELRCAACQKSIPYRGGRRCDVPAESWCVARKWSCFSKVSMATGMRFNAGSAGLDHPPETP